MAKSFQKVIYKPNAHSLDDFMVIVNGEEYKKWIGGDKTIPFSEVVDAPKLYLDGQSTQNIMRTPSKQQLVNTFGAHNHDNVIIQVLEKGVLQGATQKEGYSTTNDSKSSGNQLAGGARNGGR